MADRVPELVPDGFPIDLVVDEGVEEQLVERARNVLLRAARGASRPVLHGRIVLRIHHDPARERPAVAKASLNVGGRVIRAQVAAEQMSEAIDLLARRLRRNVEALEEGERAHRRDSSAADPGEWSHGSLRATRPDYFPRPPGERQLIRRKTFALSMLTPEQAALEMNVLDYDFHLFTNAETGEQNVVFRRPDGTIWLATSGPTSTETAATIAVDPVPATVMLPEDAIERLNLGGERFVFYVDAHTRQGSVLYVRDDGHYGLIEAEAIS